MPVLGTSPSSLSWVLRIVWTIASVAGVLCVTAASAEPKQPSPAALSERKLLMLTVPFMLAYVVLLLPRAFFVFTLDRYLLFLTPFALLLLLRLFDRIGRHSLGPIAYLTLAAMACYTVTTTHDFFAVHRANLRAVDEIRAAGVPRDQISGGTEYNAYTQLLEGGYIHATGIRLPNGHIFTGEHAPRQSSCWQASLELFPVVHPRYATAYPGSLCLPAAAFSPVTFHTWLPPFHRTIVVVHYLQQQ